MELLPARRGTTLPAEMAPDEVLRQFEKLEAVVKEQRRQRDEQEAAEREVRAREADESHRVAELFAWGPGSTTRAKARVELQERYSAVVTKLHAQEEAEVEALKRECKRREGEVRARWAEQKGVQSRLLQAEYDQLIADQKAGFDLGEAEWILRRGKEKRRLEHEPMSNERSVREGLTLWERLSPSPARR